jgi:hypothetical protein
LLEQWDATKAAGGFLLMQDPQATNSERGNFSSICHIAVGQL